MSFIESLLNDEIVLIYVLIMFSILVAFSCYFFERSRKVSRTINEIVNKLEEVTEAEPVHRIEQFNEWMKSNGHRLDKYFVKSWDSYHAQFKQFLREGQPVTPDVYDHFVESDFEQDAVKRKLVDMVPGIFLSMGILGTFLGLIIGTQHIDTSSADSLRNSVTLLITGLKTKFFASILGIFQSIGWQLYDKWRYTPRIWGAFHRLLLKLDDAFPTTHDGAVLKEMLQTQKQHAEEFRVYMTENMIPQIAHEISRAMHAVFNPYFERTHEMMEQALVQAKQSQVQGVQEMVDRFVQTLNEVTGDHMKELGEALRQTVDWQKKVHEEMTQLVESLKESAREQSMMVEKTTLLTERINEYSERIAEYQSALETTVAELKETTDKNKELQLITSQLLEKMTQERRVFDEQFSRHMEVLSHHVSAFNESVRQLNDLQDHHSQLMKDWNAYLTNLNLFTEKSMEMSKAVSDTTEQWHEVQKEMVVLLEDVLNSQKVQLQTQSKLAELQSLVGQEHREMDLIQQSVRKMLEEQIKQMENSVNSLKQHWESASRVLSQTNQQLSQSMEQFANHMHKGLEKTFKEFDKELANAVTYLERGVGTLHAVMSDWPDEMEKFASSVKTANEHLRSSVKEAGEQLARAVHEVDRRVKSLANS